MIEPNKKSHSELENNDGKVSKSPPNKPLKNIPLSQSPQIRVVKQNKRSNPYKNKTK